MVDLGMVVFGFMIGVLGMPALILMLCYRLDRDSRDDSRT